MKFTTWNVNSLNVRLPHVLDWLANNPVDVLCLQETKQEDSKFDYAAIEAAGYHAVHFGQKTYNGVAILSKQPMSDVTHGIAGFDDEQKRVIAATINGKRVICVYVVNGQAVGSEKYAYKMRWLDALHYWLQQELTQYPELLVLGDYNIAPEDKDCHDPEAWQGEILVSPQERDAFSGLLALGLHDSFRLFNDEAKQFTWWDYRMMAFRRNRGMRIDHILVSDALKAQCVGCEIDKTPRKWERPSDHTPITLELAP